MLLFTCHSLLTQTRGFAISGVNFLDDQWSAPRLDSLDATESLKLLVEQTASNYVAITFTWFQFNISTTDIYPQPSSATAAQIASFVAQAQARGVRVMIRPLVDPLWSNPATAGTWRGMIGTGFNAADWAAWGASYSKYIVEYAALAESLRADSFCVGAELTIAQMQTHLWLELVSAVRKVYSGTVVYAANHGSEDAMVWWSAVDVIGIDAYYNLALSGNPTVPQIVAAWAPYVVSIANLSSFYNRPVMFPEIGYCSAPNAFDFEVVNCTGTEVDLPLQAALIEGVYQAFDNLDWFQGIFIWDWLTETTAGTDSNDPGFTVANKPAAAVMKARGQTLV